MARLGLLTLLLAAAPCAAQDGAFGAASDPSLLSVVDRSSAPSAAVTPLALAVALAFDATTWAAVGVSTSATAGEVAELLARGYYRLELLQMALIARDSGKRLLDLRTARTKDGKSLRALAVESRVPYDAVLDRATALADGVETRLAELETVRPLVPARGAP